MRKPQIIVCVPSNNAVDEIMNRFLTYGDRKWKAVRAGDGYTSQVRKDKTIESLVTNFIDTHNHHGHNFDKVEADIDKCKDVAREAMVRETEAEARGQCHFLGYLPHESDRYRIVAQNTGPKTPRVGDAG